jgi:hypothetical protein
MLQLGPLALAWKRPAALWGWKAAEAGVLDPVLRGGITYLLGCRYANAFKRPADAAELFRRAARLAPDSAVRGLAEAELARMKGG